MTCLNNMMLYHLNLLLTYYVQQNVYFSGKNQVQLIQRGGQFSETIKKIKESESD